jgi:Uma2 family endonuclease
MPRPAEAQRMSAEDYLRFEEAADAKHEFVDGFAFAMAGAGDKHNIITPTLGALLRAAARGTACRAYVADMRLAVPGDIYYYPDALLTCDEADLGADIKRHPCLVVEVLSESTADIDRGEKLLNYRKIPSLKAYLLVSQTIAVLELYHQVGDGWRHDIIESGAFRLPCLGLELTLEEVYEDTGL